MTTPDPQYVTIIYADDPDPDLEITPPEAVLGPFPTEDQATEAGMVSLREYEVHLLTPSFLPPQYATPRHQWVANLLSELGWPTEWLDESYTLPAYLTLTEGDRERFVELHSARGPVTITDPSVRYVIDVKRGEVSVYHLRSALARTYTPFLLDHPWEPLVPPSVDPSPETTP